MIEQVSPEPRVHPLLAAATSLLHELMTSQTITTVYSHENQRNNGELRFNCYGFISHLIKSCHEEAFGDLLIHMEFLHHKGIPRSLDTARPSPDNFFHIFKGLHKGSLTSLYWAGIEDVFSVIPGDLLVYLKPGYVSPTHWRKNKCPVTHIMLVSDIISVTSHHIELKIIDSAHQPHNTDDTRSKLQIQGGLGESYLLIKEAEAEGIYLLSWEKECQNYMKKELFAGRLLPFPLTALQ